MRAAGSGGNRAETSREPWRNSGWNREDWRTFRADRITPRTPTGPRFTPRELPGGEVSRFVAARFRGSDGSGEWPCRGQVILGLPAAEVSRYARDGVVEELGPDRCRLTPGAWSWAGLAATGGLFAAGIEVVGPPELKAAFAHLGRRYTTAAATAAPAAPAPHGGPVAPRNSLDDPPAVGER
ncbi:hypothetical protein GCM10027073_12960 [Streptomyces chlorus]